MSQYVYLVPYRGQPRRRDDLGGANWFKCRQILSPPKWLHRATIPLERQDIPTGCPSDAHRTAWLCCPYLVQAITVVSSLAGLAHGVEAGHRGDVEDAVGGGGRRTDGMAQ